MDDDKFQRTLDIINGPSEPNDFFYSILMECTPAQKVIAMTDIIFRLVEFRKDLIKEANKQPA